MQLSFMLNKSDRNYNQYAWDDALALAQKKFPSAKLMDYQEQGKIYLSSPHQFDFEKCIEMRAYFFGAYEALNP